MKIKSLLIIFLLYLNLFASETYRDITLQLSWLHQFQFAGYYVAKEKGFYKDVGLDVTINEFNFKLDIHKVLEKKEAEFVVGRTSFIIDKIAGKDLVALASIYQHSPMMLLVREDSNIKTVKDLKNKNIMITGDAKNTATIQAMLSSQKITLKDINIQAHTFNLDDLINGKTDAMASYVSNEPIRLKDKNIKYNILHPKDYGFDFYSGMLFTSQKMIKKDPDSVKAFYDATIKGWEYAFSNIEESAKLIFEKYNSQNKSLDNLIQEGEILKTLAYDKDERIGKIDIQRIKEIANVFLVMGFINKDYSLDNFIYEYNDKKSNKIYLTKEEKQWIKKHQNLIHSTTEWSPILQFNQDKKLEGIAIDFMDIIAKKTNLHMNFKESENWTKVLEDIRNKKLDFTIATGETKNKREYGLFTKSYAKFPLVIVTKNDVTFITKTSELNDKIVAVGKNYTAHEFLRENHPNIKLMIVKDTNEALHAVEKGTAYAMVDILPVVADKIKKLKLANLKISGNTEYNFELKTFIRNDYPTLVSILNKGIKNIDEEQKNKIISKWYSVEYVSEVDYELLMKVILFFSIFIAILIYLQNMKLRKKNQTLKDAFKELKNTKEDLVAAEKMSALGELVSNISHELNSPLGVSILGSTHMEEKTIELEKLLTNEELTQDDLSSYFKTIEETSKSITKNLERSRTLVNSFKNIAVDHATEEKREFNIKEYIDEILISMSMRLKNTKHKIIVECPDNILINSYPGYIAQIIINFINNSILHGFDKNIQGEIKLQIEQIDSYLKITYTDNGKGIDMENKEKIFDQYYTTKRGKGGSGLGLYIVKSIIENKLQGTVSFKSQKNEGVTFLIKIPFL